MRACIGRDGPGAGVAVAKGPDRVAQRMRELERLSSIIQFARIDPHIRQIPVLVAHDLEDQR